MKLVSAAIVSSLLLFANCSPLNNEVKAISYLANYSSQKTVTCIHGGVATEHPLASKVGLYILEKGGNAIDAAIAVQFALAVVFPRAGNIGGGGFMTMRLADGTTRVLDFRERAPIAASKNMYLDSLGNKTDKSTSGHLACGVPGTVAGMFESLKYATLPLKTLMQPAIDLAEKGYGYQLDIPHDDVISTVPNDFIGAEKCLYRNDTVFRQPQLAATLKRIRDNGRKEFYEGETAKLIVEEMKRGGGIITMQDLKKYTAKWRSPIEFTYRGYKIITMSLPSSGGILLNQMLKMIEPYPMSKYGFGSVAAINLMIEAERRAFKDRATYLGDADFVNVPQAKLLSQQYIKDQMKDFHFGQSGVSTPIDNVNIKPESKETTHFSVVDKWGNAVSVTTTLNGPYGSRVVVGRAGFLLNNEMDDFSVKEGTSSFSGGVGGVANSIQPGKRMLSSMSPTIVTKDGKLFMVLGTPGGTTIPTSVFQTIVNVIDFNCTATDAVFKPKFHHEWMPDVIQMGTFPQSTIDSLENIGYKITGGGFSSMEVVQWDDRSKRYEIVSQHGSAEGY